MPQQKLNGSQALRPSHWVRTCPHHGASKYYVQWIKTVNYQKTTMSISQNDQVMTLEELSGYLKIPKSTLYKLVQEGRIPGQKLGKQWRFAKAAIDRWLDSELTKYQGPK